MVITIMKQLIRGEYNAMRETGRSDGGGRIAGECSSTQSARRELEGEMLVGSNEMEAVGSERNGSGGQRKSGKKHDANEMRERVASRYRYRTARNCLKCIKWATNPYVSFRAN